jgi:hypothetical protein
VSIFYNLLRLQPDGPRCEAARHCRWVDAVIPDAPWIIDADFISKWEINYVAHDEDPYGAVGHDDVYSFVKSQGKPFHSIGSERGWSLMYLQVNSSLHAERRVFQRPVYSSASSLDTARATLIKSSRKWVTRNSKPKAQTTIAVVLQAGILVPLQVLAP